MRELKQGQWLRIAGQGESYQWKAKGHCSVGDDTKVRPLNHQGLLKSDDACYSQWRRANKWWSNRVCQRIGFICDSKASRRYTGRSLTWKTLRRSRISLPLDQWWETTTHQRWRTKKMQHGELRTDRCAWFIDKLFKLSNAYISYISTAGSSSSYIASSHNTKWEYASPEPWETENTNNNEDNETVRGNPLRDLLELFRKSCGRKSSSIQERTHAFFSRESASEPQRKVVSGKHSIFTHFPNNRNCEVCKRTKITRAPCRKRTGNAEPRAENFGDLVTADHKVLSEGCGSRNNHRFAVVVQDLATQWIQSYPCKTKTSQEIQRSSQKFLEPNRKPKVIYTDNSLEFGKACQELSWNHRTSTPLRSETNGVAERAVRRIKEGTSAVLLQSGLDEKWWADSLECYCYLRNVQELLSEGNHLTNGGLANRLKDH